MSLSKKAYIHPSLMDKIKALNRNRKSVSSRHGLVTHFLRW